MVINPIKKSEMDFSAPARRFSSLTIHRNDLNSILQASKMLGEEPKTEVGWLTQSWYDLLFDYFVVCIVLFKKFNTHVLFCFV